MKTIPLKRAHELIEAASAVIVNRDALMYPSFDDLTGDSDNEFLYLGWTDSDGLEFVIKACEGENQEVEVTDDGNLVLVDDEGEKFELTLLTTNVVKV
ncbi:MAG: hypothetical protein EBT92_14360 [Planctomycetes bacterium]|nr:hypothetical protein [Planctomycetota bacterium]